MKSAASPFSCSFAGRGKEFSSLQTKCVVFLMALQVELLCACRTAHMALANALSLCSRPKAPSLVHAG